MNDKVTNINLVAVAVYGIVNNLFHTRPFLAERKNSMTKRCCTEGTCKLCLSLAQEGCTNRPNQGIGIFMTRCMLFIPGLYFSGPILSCLISGQVHKLSNFARNGQILLINKSL